MELYCKHCNKTVKRDARTNSFKTFMTKRGYKSYCEDIGKIVFLNPKQ